MLTFFRFQTKPSYSCIPLFWPWQTNENSSRDKDEHNTGTSNEASLNSSTPAVYAHDILQWHRCWKSRNASTCELSELLKSNGSEAQRWSLVTDADRCSRMVLTKLKRKVRRSSHFTCGKRLRGPWNRNSEAKENTTFPHLRFIAGRWFECTRTLSQLFTNWLKYIMRTIVLTKSARSAVSYAGTLDRVPLTNIRDLVLSRNYCS